MRSALTKSVVDTCKSAGIAAPLKILSWSIDRSESTTFAKAPATYPPHVYFGGVKERAPPGAAALLQTLSGEALSEIRNSDDFVRFFSSEKGWRDNFQTTSSVSVGGVRSFLNPNQRARRIAKERRLEEICRFLSTAAADVLCLQDCDDEAIKAIESLRFTLPRPDAQIAAVYRYRFVSAVEITSTGVTCSFIREAENGLAVDAAPPKWTLDTMHVGMPFVTFSIKPTAAADSVSNRSLAISNVDLTHVVRELATEHSSQHSKKQTSPSGTEGGGGSGDLNRDFNYILRGSLPKAATYAWKATKDGKMPSDSLQIQREAALALLARGGHRLYVPDKGAAADEEAEDLSGDLPPIAPDIMIGNTHLRHGWTKDRMRHVLPDYVDAWELAGRNDANWETYAFYRTSSAASSDSAHTCKQPTNARYFLDSEEDGGLGVGNEDGHEGEDSPTSKSRAKGGRYSRCILRKALLPSAAINSSGLSSRVQYDCPRPMIEENCSCSDQFPILVTIE